MDEHHMHNATTLWNKNAVMMTREIWVGEKHTLVLVAS
jgi:hypothetical protein